MKCFGNGKNIDYIHGLKSITKLSGMKISYISIFSHILDKTNNTFEKKEREKDSFQYCLLAELIAGFRKLYKP